MKLEQDQFALKYEGITSYSWTSQVPIDQKEKYDQDLDRAISLIGYGKYEEAADILFMLSEEYGIADFDCNHHLSYILESNETRIKLLEPILKTVEVELKRVGFKSGDHMPYNIPNRPFYRAIHHLCLCYIKTKNKRAKGIKWFQKLLDLNPNDNLGVRYILAWEYLTDKKYSKAIKIIDHYNRKDYYDAELLYSGALNYFSQGNLEKGKTYLTRALSINPLYGLLIIQFPNIMKKYLPLVENIPIIAHGSLDEALELYRRTYHFWQPFLEIDNDVEIRSELFDVIRNHFDRTDYGEQDNDERDEEEDEEEEDAF